MGPARTTVCRYMLVENVGQVVGTIHIVPKEFFWKILNVFKGLANMWGGWVFTTSKARGAIKTVFTCSSN